jgi:predicted aspartyl protease
LSETAVVNKENKIYKKYLSLWDTGATNTVITQNVIETLNLKPVSIVKVNTPAGLYEIEQYYVDIILSNDTIIQNLLVSRGLLRSYDMLIGMDIIGRGDFAVSNLKEQTTFSFRMPSLEKIDYSLPTGGVKS